MYGDLHDDWMTPRHLYEESERLFEEWKKLPEEAGTFEEYCKTHGSEELLLATKEAEANLERLEKLGITP